MVGFYFLILGSLLKVSTESNICEVIEKSQNVKHAVVWTKSNENFSSDDFDFHCVKVPVQLLQTGNISIPEVKESFSIIFVLDHLNDLLIDELNANLDPFFKKKNSVRIIFKINSVLEKSTVHKLFRMMWSKTFLNVVLMERHKISTFEPFTEQGFSVREIDMEKDDPFPDKLKNLHKHEIKVSIFPEIIRFIPYPSGGRYGGVDGHLAYNLLNHINATAKYTVPADGYTYGLINATGTNTITGTLGDIAYGRADVGFNSRLVDEFEKFYAESLYPVQNEIACVLYPKSTLSPSYLNFIRTFGYNIWVILISVFILVTFGFKYFQKVVRNFGKPQSQIDSLSNVELFFKIFLGEAIKDPTRFSSLRIYLITWIIFSYICTTIYFARLESAFVKPAYNKDLNLLADLKNIEGNIYAPVFFLRIAEKNLIPELYEVVKEKSITVHDMTKVLFLKPPKNSTLFSTLELAKFIIQKTFDYSAKRPAYHISHEYLFVSPNVYIVPNGSPYLEKFEELISRYNEFGFISHWEEMTKLKILFESKDRPESEEEFEEIIDEEEPEIKDQKIVLTMSILQGAFYVWIIGIVVSLLIFFVEANYTK